MGLKSITKTCVQPLRWFVGTLYRHKVRWWQSTVTAQQTRRNNRDSKVHGANMRPTWVLSAPDGPVLALWTYLSGKQFAPWNALIHNETLYVIRSHRNRACFNTVFQLWFLAAIKHLYEWYFPSVCLSVCLSVCHTFFTMFSSSHHHDIFRSDY